MEQNKIDRINALARKAKNEGLTPEECLEREELRREYIAAVKHNLTGQLDSIVVVDENGNKHKLRK